MTSDDESIRMSVREARSRGRGMSAAFCRDDARSGWLFAGLLVAGLLSCNSLLGIGEASLQCDANPCATDVAAGGAGDARSDGAASSDSGRASGAGGSSGAGAGVATAVGSAETRDGLPIDRATPPAGEAPEGSDSEGNGSEGSGSEGGASGGDEVDAAVPAGQAGTSSGPVGGGGAPANACESGDACGDCLCSDCASEVAVCTETAGCFEIVACARINGCTGLDCYCGSALPIACATSGQANGPCLDAALAAPLSRLPTLANPSAGPAADAALEIANCTLRNCAGSCGD
jgi:hypothetical protein